ncbi:hypothetical protein BDK62_104176 [Halomonas alkaliantarctica]|nr:hypothetical protein BDK62_104176 [Halomonas alkaliantarctica]
MQFIVNIDVEDIRKAITFYEHGLGLQLIRWYGCRNGGEGLPPFT